MQIDYAVFAEGANTSSEGNLNVFGIFREITAHSFPAIHPAMSLVVFATMDEDDYAKKLPLVITITHESGNVAGKFVLDIETGNDRSRFRINLNMPIYSFEFSMPGAYSVEINLAEARYETSFMVVKV